MQKNNARIMDGDYNCLVELWQKESGWNVTTGDPNKAYGKLYFYHYLY